MKRILALSLTLILILSNINVLAASNTGAFSEDYYIESAELLRAINVSGVTGTGAMIDKSVSRMTLLRMVIDVLNKGMAPISTGKSVGFTDVSSADYGYIEFAKSKGMILQDSSSFRPDDDADLNFAKMVMTGAAGYEIKNDLYIKTAIDIGLTEKLRADSATAFKLGDACVMLYNFVTSVKVRRSTGNTYTFDSEVLLKSIYDIEVIKGTLVANDDTSADGLVCGKDQVRVQYLNSGVSINLFYSTDSSEYLGRRVKVYYTSEDEVILIYLLDSDDLIAEFDGARYLGYDSQTREISWGEYTASNRWESAMREVKEDMPASADIIFNGRYTTAHSTVYGILENGNGYDIDKVQLIDTNRDGDTDLIKIDAYKAVMVANANEKGFLIKDKISGQNFDFDAVDKEPEVFVYDQSEKEIKISNIKENSIASIYECFEQPVKVKIVVSEAKTIGTISSVYEKDGRVFINVEGSEYKLSRNLESHRGNFVAGQRYSLLFDKNGFVAGYTMNAATSNLGGISKITIDEKEDGALQFTIYSMDGEFIECKTSQKWKVNGYTPKVNDKGRVVYTDENGFSNDVIKTLKGTFVQYSVDANGYLRSVNTAKRGAEPGELGYTLGMNDPEGVLSIPATIPFKYRNATGGGGVLTPNWSAQAAGTSIDSNTKVFQMPAPTIEDDREALFSNNVTLKDDQDLYAIAYSLSGPQALTADVVVVYATGGVMTSVKSSARCVVKDIGQAINKNEEIGYKLTLVNTSTGSEFSITTADLKFPECDAASGNPTGNNVQLERGDLVQYALDEKGDATGFVVLYDASSKSAAENQPNVFMHEGRRVLGSVYAIDGNAIAYVQGSGIVGNPETSLQIAKYPDVFIVDPSASDDEFTMKGTPSDLVSYLEDNTNYTRVIIFSKYGQTTAMIAYK